MRKCKQMRKPQCTFTTWSCSWRYKSSRTRLQSCRQTSSAKNTVFSSNGPVVEKPRQNKNGKRSQCSTGNFAPIVVPGQVLQARAQLCLLHRYRKTCLVMSLQVRPATHRSDDSNVHASRNWSRNPTKNKPKPKIWTMFRHQEIGSARSSQKILKTKKCQYQGDTPTHTSQDSDSERPVKMTSRKHSIHIHLQKDKKCENCNRTQITGAACKKRIGNAVLRAENFGDLITADLNENGCQRDGGPQGMPPTPTGGDGNARVPEPACVRNISSRQVAHARRRRANGVKVSVGGDDSPHPSLNAPGPGKVGENGQNSILRWAPRSSWTRPSGSRLWWRILTSSLSI